MNYFCDVKLQGRKNSERRIFTVLANKEKSNRPNLTKEELATNSQYRAYLHDFNPKMIHVVYTVYSTEEEIFANTFDNKFIEILEEDKAKKIASGEFNVDTARTKIKNKSTSKLWLKMIAVVGSICIVFGALVLGVKLGRTTSNVTDDIQVNNIPVPDKNSVDGMIIPEQIEMDTEVQQITVSLDRSYASTPQEDLKLKGEVVDGKATITLPAFDRFDFFSHIPGYTYGFSTNPKSDKIQYYGGNTYTFTEDVKLYRVSVKYAGGSGTKEDPYLIDYYDQLELMAEEKARGYFKQIANISFPYNTNHNVIDTVNELKEDPEKEKFVYDGGGYLIEGLNAPLFGKVSGALIENVNIKNCVMNSSEYKNYGAIVCEAYNYFYMAKDGSKSYETGETVIKHCSVSNTSLNIKYPQVESSVREVEPVVPPDLVQYDEKGNKIEQKKIVTKSAENAVGSISGLGCQIEDCYVYNVGIICNIDDYFQYVGGIAGKPANVINSAVNTFSAEGNIFISGGIVGSAGGTKKYDAAGSELPYYYGGNIHNCAVYNIRLNSESAVGGLVGESTTNAKDAMISNSYVHKANISSGIVTKGVIKTSGLTGGAVGTDGQEKNGHVIINTVTPSEYAVMGLTTESTVDDVRLAPPYAYAQETILTILNKNSVNTENPGEILEGNFIIDSNISDEDGNYAYPSTISDLFSKTINEQ